MTSMMAARVEGAGANGQDRVALLPLADGVVAVVADGAGGTGGGAKAATQVIERVRQAVEQGRELNERGLRQLLLEIGIELEGGGIGQTTAVIVVVSKRSLVGASVGDSGAWFVGPDAWRELTEGQPRKPLLGGGLAEPFTFTCETREGTLLLATDGVLKYAPAEALHELARRELGADDCCAAMIDRARLPNGALQDDAAVAIIRLRPEAALVSALRALPGDHELERRAADELEQWMLRVLPRGGPLDQRGSDGLSFSRFEVSDDGALTLEGSIWSCVPQALFPFEARLRLGTDRIDAYEVSFGDLAAPEGTTGKLRRPAEWMLTASRPEQ